MKRFFPIAAVAVLGFRLWWMYLIPAWGHIETDFPSYYTAAWAISHDRDVSDVYDPEWFQREAELGGIHGIAALFNQYPPFTALVMWPLAKLPPLEVKRLWILFSLSALVITIILVSRITEWSSLWVTLIALLGGDALGNNFTFGQFYIVLTFMLVLAFYWMDRLPPLAGILVALGAVTKIFPVVFILYFAVTRRLRAATWAVGASVAFTIIGIVVIGWTPYRVYVDEVLPRTLRGEMLDPYNVHWNTLAALARRALVFEAGLNPEPILNAPLVYFFLRTFITVVVLLVTFMLLRPRVSKDQPASELVPFAFIIAALLVVMPIQTGHLQIVLFPGIAALVHTTKDVRLRGSLLLLFALICSNVMGAGTGWSRGWAMLVAFPRVYLVLALWLALLAAIGIGRFRRGMLFTATAGAILFGLVAVAREQMRWTQDELDKAVLVRGKNASSMETNPTTGDNGVKFSSLEATGFAPLHPSASGSGFVYESERTILGRLANGTAVRWSNATEPFLKENIVVAVREEEGSWAVIERSTDDFDWRVLFHRSVPVHDPVLSPDATRIVFSERIDGHYRISEWNRQAGTTRPLIEGKADYRYPAYSVSNSSLFFASNPLGDWDVFRFSLEDGTRQRLTSSGANDFMPAVSPDGKTLYFASDRRRGYRFSAIYQMDLP